MTFIDGQRVNLHHMRNLRLDPDWVVIGVRFDREMAVIASVGLTEATLTSRARQAVDLIHDQARVGADELRQELHATIGAYLVGFGPNYAAALADLIRQWDPDHPPAAIVEPRRD